MTRTIARALVCACITVAAAACGSIDEGDRDSDTREDEVSATSILVSTSSNRSSPVALSGQNVSGNVYVFTPSQSGIKSVAFYLDDPTHTKPPYHTEFYAPYDLVGTGAGNTAYPFDTSKLASGTHTFTALTTFTTNEQQVVSGTLKTGGGAPPSNCTRIVTGIDATGASNVTGALQSFIDASPNGSVICFAVGGQYRVDGQLHLANRANLTIDGRGARIFSAIRGTKSMFLIDQGGNDISISNMVIQGANPSPGVWDLTYEHNHAIQVGGAINLDFYDLQILNIGGDALYLTAGSSGGSIRWADTVHLHDSIIDGTGRMGVTITDGASNVVFDKNTFRRIAYYTFDIEPNGYVWNGVAAGAKNVSFSNNQLGPQPYGTGVADQPVGHVFVVTGTSGGGPAENIQITGNVVSGVPMDIGVYNNGGARKGITVSNNVSDKRVAGPVMFFGGVNGLTVTGNTQPLSGGALVSTSGCSNVTISGNNTL